MKIKYVGIFKKYASYTSVKILKLCVCMYACMRTRTLALRHQPLCSDDLAQYLHSHNCEHRGGCPC